MQVRFTPHALAECERRSIEIAVVQGIVELPEQIVPNIEGRMVYQSKIVFSGKIYLVRVVVEVTDQEIVVITAYRTSKIDKYWDEA
jgi:hypothetical protein